MLLHLYFTTNVNVLGNRESIFSRGLYFLIVSATSIILKLIRIKERTLSLKSQKKKSLLRLQSIFLNKQIFLSSVILFTLFGLLCSSSLTCSRRFDCYTPRPSSVREEITLVQENVRNIPFPKHTNTRHKGICRDSSIIFPVSSCRGRSWLSTTSLSCWS